MYLSCSSAFYDKLKAHFRQGRRADKTMTSFHKNNIFVKTRKVMGNTDVAHYQGRRSIYITAIADSKKPLNRMDNLKSEKDFKLSRGKTFPFTNFKTIKKFKKVLDKKCEYAYNGYTLSLLLLSFGARVVELADTPDLGSGASVRKGSSPFSRIVV